MCLIEFCCSWNWKWRDEQVLEMTIAYLSAAPHVFRSEISLHFDFVPNFSRLFKSHDLGSLSFFPSHHFCSSNHSYPRVFFFFFLFPRSFSVVRVPVESLHELQLQNGRNGFFLLIYCLSVSSSFSRQGLNSPTLFLLLQLHVCWGRGIFPVEFY